MDTFIAGLPCQDNAGDFSQSSYYYRFINIFMSLPVYILDNFVLYYICTVHEHRDATGFKSAVQSV